MSDKDFNGNFGIILLSVSKVNDGTCNAVCDFVGVLWVYFSIISNFNLCC